MAKRKAKPSKHPRKSKGKSAARARSFWSGTISFGLVSVPVNVFPGTQSSGARLRLVDRNGQPLHRRFYCPTHEKPVHPEHLVRGYEVNDGEYVVVTDSELEELEPQKTREIDLRRFIDMAEMKPMYFQRPYFLTPAGDSTKAYRLLAEVMERTGRAGIATFVMRGKEYLVAILAENGILRAETLRFADEIRSPEDIGLPEPVEPSRTDVTHYKQAMQRLAEKELDLKELEDTYTHQLLALVRKKRERGEGVVEVPGHEEELEPAAEDEQDGAPVDLLETIRTNLNPGKKK